MNVELPEFVTDVASGSVGVKFGDRITPICVVSADLTERDNITRRIAKALTLFEALSGFFRYVDQPMAESPPQAPAAIDASI